MTAPAPAIPAAAGGDSLLRWSTIVAAGIVASNLALPDLLDLPFKNLLRTELNLGRDDVSLFLSLAALPWYFKILAGLLSDSFPIFGMHRGISDLQQCARDRMLARGGRGAARLRAAVVRADGHERDAGHRQHRDGGADRGSRQAAGRRRPARHRPRHHGKRLPCRSGPDRRISGRTALRLDRSRRRTDRGGDHSARRTVRFARAARRAAAMRRCCAKPARSCARRSAPWASGAARCS